MKNTLLFICSTNILVRLLTVNMKNSLTPKNQKMFDSILVTLLKMRPHYSQSSLENATPSSGTFPLASYKAVPPPPPGQIVDFSGEKVAYQTIVLCGHITSELSVLNHNDDENEKISKTKTLKVQHICDLRHFDFVHNTHTEDQPLEIHS